MGPLVVFLVFFLPFVVFPFEISPYEKPKVIVAQFLIEALVILSLQKWRTASFLQNKTFFWILISIFILSFFHLFRNPNIESFFGNPIRLQGILFLWHLLFFSYICSKLKFPKISPVIPISSSILLTLSALLMNKNAAERAVGTLGEPNALAQVAIFIWPFIFFALIRSSVLKTYVRFFSLIFIALVILQTRSGSGLIALTVQFISVAFIFIFKTSARKTLVISFILIWASMTLPNLEKPRILENRAEIWKVATTLGMRKPIFGHGFGNIETSLYSYSQTFTNNNIRYQHVDSTHNIFLDWWAQGGIIGLVLISILLYKSSKNLAAKKDPSGFIALIGIITALSFNPASAASLVALWWLIGQGFRKN